MAIHSLHANFREPNDNFKSGHGYELAKDILDSFTAVIFAEIFKGERAPVGNNDVAYNKI